jgi:hypothetical protein
MHNNPDAPQAKAFLAVTAVLQQQLHEQNNSKS